MKYLLHIILAILMSSMCTAQIMQSGHDELMQLLPEDTLERRHEWWLGVGASFGYSVGFGTLTLDVIGGTAPGQPSFTVTPNGGMGYSAAFATIIEYRPIFSPLGYVYSVGVDLQWMKAETQEPIGQGIYAKNAVFEAQSTVLYLTNTLATKMQLGKDGSFATVGLRFDLPISVVDSYVWQHEVWEGEAPDNLPGSPQTSIKFSTSPSFQPRAGVSIGFGHDFLVGMFGYRGQLLSPYVILQGATPTVSDPTSWNSVSVRLGVMWRGGID